ncbi:sulfur oxidation c-type cytochrome SoxA [Henriciella mobilis]|uniref:sulfur oxidation c-type cytochrome SoxA n=1 Tax=Henriciella mobilis TaxID=2305467 RepID=UPI000E67246F|nr:sulfur oxidation c-type cytochrome SoxA [Henriciella mobilis]RIJ18310.1 sulfur oxidation c-type cytochrome SoxA [Henriciella mobilis]RIJ24886.1 sulfur oxidation c-type cytochrome SoxA [Henriciella mobilis]
MIRAGLIACLVFAACSAPPEEAGTPVRDPLPDDIKRSGTAFLQPDTRALQADDFANPGFLWIDRGEKLFRAGVDGSKACAACHGEDGADLVGAAAHYPQVDAASGELVNIEGRINQCREQHQSLPPLDYESDDLLALTAYVSHLSRGEPVSVDVSGPAARYYEMGRDYFFTRRGQLNLACSQCHNEHWGEKLRGDTISQGHGNAFPAYRLEWQTLGSLHRRLNDCDEGVRAEPMPLGSDTYKAVELYLAKRAEGLPIETPGVRR